VSKATDLREQALQKFLDAKALVAADGSIAVEDQAAFEEHMADAMRLDKEHETAAKNENLSVGRLDERLSAYTAAATGGPGMRFNRTTLDPSRPMSLGEQFVQSKEYQDLQASGALESDNRHFDTGRIVLSPRPVPGAAATDLIDTVTDGPAYDLVTPMYLPGILPLPQRPLTVRSLFGAGRMTSGDHISYAAQTGFDNGAAAVAQATAVDGSGVTGGVKPQSSIAWERRIAPAEWIATWMVTTRQALSDAGVIRGLIDNQGRLMLQLEEEDQLLAGNGTAPNLSGILDQSIQTLDLTGEDNLDGIRTARRLVRTGLSRLQADWIVVNPEDSEEIDLLKDDNGLYRGGNPIGNFSFDQSIWRLARAESEAMTAGTALVGARAGATVYERQPITVLTADQHSDFFIRNLIVILFEERLAFPVWFPSAFVEVTLADWGS
jgi:HK97 family phage major capsid protein